MIRRLLATLALPMALIACKHSLPAQNTTTPPPGGGGGGTPTPSVTCSPDTVYFQQQVLPVLVSNCTMSGCHDVASHRDGVILTSYSYVMSTAGIRPGNPGSSDLYEAITETDLRKRMPPPPAAPLTDVQKEIIRKWIQQDAKNLSCQSACDTSGAMTYSAKVKPILTAKCTGCHGGGAPQAGIDLSTYTGLKAKVNDGRLWGAINHQPGFSAMPKNGNKLSDCELTTIRKWIAEGALNN